MTNSLQIGSHLCDGCVIDASRLTGPGCERAWYLGGRPPGRHRYPRLPPLVLCRRPAYPPGRTATQTIPGPLLWLLLADWSRQPRPQAVLVSGGGNGGPSVS